VEALVAGDEQAQVRQLGVVDSKGRAAAHTGTDCIPACGHLVRDGFTVQGNLLERDTCWPARSISSPIGPKLMLTDAWVAIAPTPASSHGTTGPTPRKCDWTATPKRPVTGSRATML
jgi:hypothetical protein